jgi:hypothetical protein
MLDVTSLAARRLRKLRQILYNADFPANDLDVMYSEEVIENVLNLVRHVCTEIEVTPEKSEREDEAPRIYNNNDEFNIQPGEIMLVFNAAKAFDDLFFKESEDVVSRFPADNLFMRVECGTAERDAATAARMLYERFEAVTQREPGTPPARQETEAEQLAREAETVSHWFDDMVAYARWLSVTTPVATGAHQSAQSNFCNCQEPAC